ncbi:hypothetical protein L3081_24240 [Colwellia sp. MSW7]|uniref:Uncharacterized protein n=1 Tax=Colwellia maritima TaxID=2912588 RepID=A0ABS9X6U6_9GAMM|nr:hypothetical protein [Colwellia maritima]MCI2285939.1 hypothetical protein [Colwellia maritima]
MFVKSLVDIPESGTCPVGYTQDGAACIATQSAYQGCQQDTSMTVVVANVTKSLKVITTLLWVMAFTAPTVML